MKRCLRRFFLLWPVILVSGLAIAEPETLGWLESSYLQPWGVRVTTKLDTGARTSSIHANNVHVYKKKREKWVRFTLPVGEREGYDSGIEAERPLIRETRIKEHVGESVPRYVVILDVCLNGKTYPTEVTLADRSQFNYTLILGRNMMSNNIIVDPGQKFISWDKSCPRKKRKTKTTDKADSG